MVFSGTAIKAMISVSFRAWMNAGRVRASSTGPRPLAKVVTSITATGAISNSPR